MRKKAPEAISYLGRLALSLSGQVYAFWLDERDHTDWRKPGYLIYYTMLDDTNSPNLVNQKIANSLCECCRMAVAFDSDNQPVLFARFIYPDNIRDHGLIRIPVSNEKPHSQRVTFDEWKIRGCPEHGPAISISKEDRYHVTWFTQGSVRQGLFYAYSSDQGLHFSNPLLFGTPENMLRYPDVLANGEQVFLTWNEFIDSK